MSSKDEIQSFEEYTKSRDKEILSEIDKRREEDIQRSLRVIKLLEQILEAIKSR